MSEKKKKTRHILGISGGKDSAALAVHLRDRIPNMEYVFCDTGKELKETYEFIDKLEAYLNAHVIRLPKELPGFSENYDFDHFIELFNGYLPSASNRWCTKDLKLKPFEHFIGENSVINYVGIRADEARVGYISTKPNVKTVFPFIEDGIDKEGVLRILDDAGIGLPEYYSWRSRSGCYFCFYQSRGEWKSLKEKHPDLFEKAKAYEKDDFTWRENESLDEAVAKAHVEKGKLKTANSSPLLVDILGDDDKETVYEKPCLICHL
jgi:hypothetical protein